MKKSRPAEPDASRLLDPSAHSGMDAVRLGCCDPEYVNVHY
jgi:hypothetical protein